MQCAYCGFPFAAKVKFCRKCGKLQPADSANTPAHATPANATSSATLVMPAAPFTPDAEAQPASIPPVRAERTHVPQGGSLGVPAIAMGACALVIVAGGAAWFAASRGNRAQTAPATSARAVAVVNAPPPVSASSAPPAPAVSQPAASETVTAPPSTPETSASTPSSTRAEPAAPAAKEQLNAMLKAAHVGDWPAVQAAAQSIAPPDPLPDPQRQRAQALNAEALHALRDGHAANALAALTAAAQADPNSAEIRSNLGYVQMRVQNWADAERNVAAALELGPRRAAAWANLAEIMAEKDNTAAARAALRLAVYFSADRQRTVAAMSNLEQNFTSAKYRDVVTSELPEIATIPEKP